MGAHRRDGAVALSVFRGAATEPPGHRPSHARCGDDRSGEPPERRAELGLHLRTPRRSIARRRRKRHLDAREPLDDVRHVASAVVERAAAASRGDRSGDLRARPVVADARTRTPDRRPAIS